MKLTKAHKQERGVALFLAIFALLLLSAVGLAMLFSSDTETTISVNYRDKQSAIYGALAGLQEARDRIHPLTGDLGVGGDLKINGVAPGGLHIVPTTLPTTGAPNVLYIINPAVGETVAPWDRTNKYFDDELCHEKYFVDNLSVTQGSAGVPCPADAAHIPAGNSWYTYYDNSQKKYFTASTSGTGSGDAALLETAYQLTSGSTKVPLTYKWVRITLKSDNMTPVSITGGTSGSASQLCWDGKHQQLIPSTFHTDCTPPTGGVTSINVTASGSFYTSPPTVTISGGSGSGATAVATCPDPVTGIDQCFGQLPVGVTSVTLTNPGAGYTSVPAVTITPTDGLGSGAIVNATLNSTLPVSSVGPTAPATTWASPPACYPTGASLGMAFNPAGATASVTMTGQSCVRSIAVSGKCRDSSPSSVTASGGFVGSVTWGGTGNTARSTSVTNPGNYSSSLPGSSAFTVNCSRPGTGSNAPAVTPTYGIQINTVSANGGSYQAGSPPSATFTGASPTGGSPSATATLSGTINPSAVTGLTIPFGGNGSGYDANPILTIAAPSCTPGPSCIQATGTASISTDKGVLAIKVTNGGSGYSPGFPPTVTISGGAGTGAQAVPRVGSGGAGSEGAVYLLTSLAVMPSGARAMAQMEVSVNYGKFNLGTGGAYTSIGPNPLFGTPNSQNFKMIGTDCPTCGGTPPGCDTTPVQKDAIGVYDPTNATNPSAVQSILNDLGKPNNYIGTNASPDVKNASLGDPTATDLDSFVDNIAGMLGANVYGTRPAPVNNPTLTNMGSAANPATNVVYGNYTMGPRTGYGILVVTGTLTINGDYSWNGVVLVIGAGASVMNGGGNGQINGAVIVANTAGGTLSSPNANWTGGGGNGIQYNHCLSDYLLADVPGVPYIKADAMQVISLRTEVY